jgi:hypothetical protein
LIGRHRLALPERTDPGALLKLSQPLALAILADSPEFAWQASLHPTLLEAEERLLPLQPEPAGAAAKRIALAAHQFAEGGEGELFRLSSWREVCHQQLPGNRAIL